MLDKEDSPIGVVILTGVRVFWGRSSRFGLLLAIMSHRAVPGMLSPTGAVGSPQHTASLWDGHSVEARIPKKQPAMGSEAARTVH